MNRPTKRQRLECPPSWMDVGSLEHVLVSESSPTRSTNASTQTSNTGTLSCSGLLDTPIADSVSCDIFLERFQKEILLPFRINLSGKTRIVSNNNDKLVEEEARRQGLVFRQRVAVGVNVAARALEATVAVEKSDCEDEPETTKLRRHRNLQNQAPLLVVLVNTTTTADTLCFAHIPVLCNLCNVPLLLLPDLDARTSKRLGSILGIRRASVLTFLRQKDCGTSQNEGRSTNSTTHLRKIHSSIDSFVQYSVGLIESKTRQPRCAS